MSKPLRLSQSNLKKKIESLIDVGEGIKMQIQGLKTDPPKPPDYRVILSCSFEGNDGFVEDQKMENQAFISKREKDLRLTERR